ASLVTVGQRMAAVRHQARDDA
ncbi:CDP-alcohol phosphatidyltransferase family protein, partial [Xanthomonas citri pv. citri]|nr:CDP-alcohol phosphatidyltransferase family protein [Xanthomonas citri pv. citri]